MGRLRSVGRLGRQGRWGNVSLSADRRLPCTPTFSRSRVDSLQPSYPAKTTSRPGSCTTVRESLLVYSYNSLHLPPGHLPHSVGHRYIVEVEAVMHRDTRLEVVHDVAIDLQHKVCVGLWRAILGVRQQKLSASWYDQGNCWGKKNWGLAEAAGLGLRFGVWVVSSFLV